MIDPNGVSKAFIYYFMLYYQNAESNMLWFENKRMLAMLSYYIRMHKNITHFFFLPHRKDFIPFLFLVKDSSIRLFHSHNRPLEIDLWSKKGERLYQDHYVRYGIEEL